MDLIKLLKKGDTCLTDEPAACTAFCPIHMDVKSFVEEVSKGEFKKAYKIIEKKVPFPKITCRICDHPCETVCVREKIGGSINISGLEKAIINLGLSSSKKYFSMPKNDKKVAVVGGGISGITAAFDLDKKGYNVTIYEKSDKVGGMIWKFIGECITKEIIEEELKIINEGSIDIKLNERIGKKELEDITAKYDAVYLGSGLWEENLEANFETSQVKDSPIFIGGRLLNKNDSIIYSMSSGRRAAISIDRYIQKISITASREREGTYVTRLVIDIDDIKSENRVKESSAYYSSLEAIEEARRCLKCQCLKCTKVCSHLKKYDITPKSYVRQINHNETIILGNRYANKMINSCTQCGLCKDVCPSSINMKDIISETRQSMVERGKMPVSAHDFALKDMEFSNSSYFSMIKKQPGKEKVKYVFFPGCQLPASSPEYIPEIYQYLMTEIENGVGLMLGCCGAPADWAGRQDLMKSNMEDIKNKWEAMEKPTFILACSSCYSIFERYMPDINIISLWEIIEEYGVPIDNKIKGNHILNIHDACTTRYNKKIHESIRNIAAKLGCIIEELKFTKEKTKCCGYGGLVYFANKEQSQQFIKDRIEESNRDYLVYCSMCKDLFVSEGKRAFHILDLIYGDDLEKISLRKAPNLSQRHENRILLKINLLKKFWNEDVSNLKKDYGFKLSMSDVVQKQMEGRLILFEDIEEVVNNAERNKQRFFNPENWHYLARMRINNVTYWVEYEVEDNGLLVHKVYSHRMEVVEE